MESTPQIVCKKIKEAVGSVIVGKEDVIQKVLICLLSGGHILLEDLPGTGKTTLAKALAKSTGCAFHRIQFTPDLLPSELTGINFYNQKESCFTFKKGALFSNILLADEINRATPRTQSSLLECMEERQVSVDGVTYPLEAPFLVLATQNPVETQGTFPLPEAQLDRFFMKLSVGYPDAEHEIQMLGAFRAANPLEHLQAVTSGQELLEAQEKVRQVHVGEAVKQYIVDLVQATRTHEKIRMGVSPRGSLALLRASQAAAAANGRDYCLPDDVRSLFADVVSHRLLCKGYQITQSDDTAHALAEQIAAQTPVPVENLAQRQ